MNTRVGELLEIIRKSEEELVSIRAACKHPSYFVGMWSWRVGAYHPSRICDECHSCIPGITEYEIQKAWKDFNEDPQG